MNALARLGLVLEESSSDENDEENVYLNEIKQETEIDDCVSENFLQDEKRTSSNNSYEDHEIKRENYDELQKMVFGPIVLLQRCDDLVKNYKTNQEKLHTKKSADRKTCQIQRKTKEQYELQNRPKSQTKCYYNKRKVLAKQNIEQQTTYTQENTTMRCYYNKRKSLNNKRNIEETTQSQEIIKNQEIKKKSGKRKQYFKSNKKDIQKNTNNISDGTAPNPEMNKSVNGLQNYIVPKETFEASKNVLIPGNTWQYTIEKRNNNKRCKHTQPTVIKYNNVKFSVNLKRAHNVPKTRVPCKCHICGQTFKLLWVLARHMNLNHGEYDKEYTCYKCGRRLPTKYHCQLHTSRCHAKNKQHPFAKSTDHLSITENLQNNKKSQKVETKTMMGKANVKRLSKNTTSTAQLEVSKSDQDECACKHYAKLANSDFRKYMCKKHGEYSTVVCDCCNISFRNKYFLEKHLQGETFKYSCDHCKKRFKMKAELQFHVEAMHLGIPRVQCYVCNKHLGSLKGLRKHLLWHSAPTYKCRYCSKVYTSASGKRSHEKTKHPESIK